MLLLQLDLTAFQTVEVLAPGRGWLAFVALLALEAVAVLWLGLSWFARKVSEHQCDYGSYT